MPTQFGRPFTLNGAKYFCRTISPVALPQPTSFRDLIERWRRSKRLITETDTDFEEFRAQALREVDRQLFLAISNYRRSRDLMLASSASWSWVTMYYSSFYAASAILGCLGVSVDPGFDGALIDVVKESRGAQQLSIRACPRDGPTNRRGSHRLFWDCFYHYLASFKTTLPSHLRVAAEPVRRDPTWLIDHRNLVSYDSFAAIDVCSKVKASFNPSSFPACLDPDFAEQHSAAVALLDTALWLTQEVALSTDTLSTISPIGSRRHRLESAIQRVRSPFAAGTPLFRTGQAGSSRYSLHI